MKNKFLVLIICLFLITGCKKENKNSKNIDNKTTPEDKPKITESVENKTTPEEIPEENPEENTENKTQDEENIPEENAEKEPTEEEKDYKKALISLVDSSDYVSMIKMTQTGANGKELHVLEDLKGSIKNIVLPEFKNIEPNKNYIIFLMDSETGDIVLTDVEKGLMYITGDSDENVKIIKDYLYPKQDENKDTETN